MGRHCKPAIGLYYNKNVLSSVCRISKHTYEVRRFKEKNGNKIEDDAGKQGIFFDMRPHACKAQVLAVLCQPGSRFVLYMMVIGLSGVQFDL